MDIAAAGGVTSGMAVAALTSADGRAAVGNMTPVGALVLEGSDGTAVTGTALAGMAGTAVAGAVVPAGIVSAGKENADAIAAGMQVADSNPAGLVPARVPAD